MTGPNNFRGFLTLPGLEGREIDLVPDDLPESDGKRTPRLIVLGSMLYTISKVKTMNKLLEAP